MKTDSLKVAHTPTPWEVAPRVRCNSFRILSGSIPICELDHWGERQPDLSADLKPDGQPEANARFIVQAVNSHQALIEASESVAGYLSAMEPVFRKDGEWESVVGHLKRLNAALHLAKGEAHL